MANLRGPVLVLAARHQPFEIAVLISCFVSTLISLITEPTRTLRAIETFMPGYGWIWHVAVMLGSGIALASIALKIPDCLLWERIGLSILCAVFLGYSVVAMIVMGAIGFSGAVFLFMFAIAGLFRIRQLTRDIQLLKGMGGES